MGARTPDEAANLRRDARPWPWLLVAVLGTVALTGLALLATVVSDGDIAPMDLFSDPAEVTGIPWYVGAVSDLTLFVWAAGAATFLLGALGLRRGDPPLASALMWLGTLTVLLVADDRFLLHEIVYPWLLGAPQALTFAVYAALLAIILVRYSGVLLRQPEVSVLVLGVLGLGLSVGLDVAGWDSTARRVAEEAAKLLGALAWGLFPAAVVVRHLRATTPDPA